MSIVHAPVSDPSLVADGSQMALDLALPTIARQLSVSEAEARHTVQDWRLRRADLPVPIVSLLTAFGVGRQSEAGVALAIIASGDVAAIAPEVADIVKMSVAEVSRELVTGCGMILQDLSPAKADDLRRSLRKLAGVCVTVSDQAVARFDLFAPETIEPRRCRELSSFLAQAGLGPCRFSGALVANLTKAEVVRLQTRFASCGLVALDRALQRFDLFLTDIGDQNPLDVAAFLATRVDVSGVLVECVTSMAPLRIETRLTRAAATAFCADYAAIGLQTCARLSRGNR